ncbi:MFS transporter [Acetobacter okinawensis]|uniref:MFS transporter n=1 Tax=Acetobacter okinawensis TaxID=1076594 RepID=UPI000A3624E6|nr:MFS transporter [Acetobacter okinawensis]
MQHLERKRGQPSRSFAVYATVIGGAVEWYDLILYTLYAVLFSKLFFPTTHGGLSIILSFATFGVSFIIRPMGAVFLGAYSDKYGRRRALALSSFLMMLGTGLLAVAPTYATLGVAAPLLVVFSRVLQGIAAGGEFGSAATMLAERNPELRGFYSSLQLSASGLSFVVASSGGWLLVHFFSDAEIAQWAWRLPFLFGFLIGPVATWSRLRMDESPEFRKYENHSPTREILFYERRKILVATCLTALGAYGVYLILYLPTYAQLYLGFDRSNAMVGTIAAGIVTMIAPPIFGYWGDKIKNRNILMISGAALLAIAAYPAFIFLKNYPTVVNIVVVESLITVLVEGAYYANLSGILYSWFSARNRTSAISVSYSFAQLLFGGLTPMVLSTLIQYYNNILIPSLFLLIVSVVSFLSILYVNERK